jgi:NAD(P)H dehydrogenase (quinone)
MSSVKVAVIYYSLTGHNLQLAQAAADAAKAAGAEVRLARVPELIPAEKLESNEGWKNYMKAAEGIPEATLDDLEWADVYIFSTPTRYGNVAAQMKMFLDSTGGLWAAGKLTNKVATVMTSAQNPHGGQESTALAFYNTLHHWGAIIVAPGYTDNCIFAAGGNPYGTSATANRDVKVSEEVMIAARHQACRVVQVAGWIKAGQEVAG